MNRRDDAPQLPKRNYKPGGLSLEAELDADIIKRLNSLPWGRKSAWIRAAIREKMAREEAS